MTLKYYHVYVNGKFYDSTWSETKNEAVEDIRRDINIPEKNFSIVAKQVPPGS